MDNNKVTSMEKHEEKQKVLPDEKEHKIIRWVKTHIKGIVISVGTFALLGGYVFWKCWSEGRIDVSKLSDIDLEVLRNKLHQKYMSPGTDQEAKNECRTWIDIIDNVTANRRKSDIKDYVFPKGGEHGTNLWKRND